MILNFFLEFKLAVHYLNMMNQNPVNSFRKEDEEVNTLTHD